METPGAKNKFKFKLVYEISIIYENLCVRYMVSDKILFSARLPTLCYHNNICKVELHIKNI